MPSQSKIPQLRIEVTGRCGKACLYCRAGGEGTTVPTEGELSAKDFSDIVGLLANHGVRQVKLTGGDPMLREDIVDIVHRLKGIAGIDTVDLVTRHPRAGKLALALKQAGLDLLNFSIDSLNHETWKRIVRVTEHSLEELIDAVYMAAETGIPIRLNTVVLRDINAHEIPDLIEFASKIKAELKLLEVIRDIPAFPNTDPLVGAKQYVRLDRFAEELETKAKSIEVVTQSGGLGHPMRRLYMPNKAIITIKSIMAGAWHSSIVCLRCSNFPCDDAIMALRLTPLGELQLCLLRPDLNVNIWGMIHEGSSPKEIDRAIQRVLSIYRRAQFFSGDELERIRAARLELRQRLLKPTPDSLLPARVIKGIAHA